MWIYQYKIHTSAQPQSKKKKPTTQSRQSSILCIGTHAGSLDIFQYFLFTIHTSHKTNRLNIDFSTHFFLFKHIQVSYAQNYIIKIGLSAQTDFLCKRSFIKQYDMFIKMTALFLGTRFFVWMNKKLLNFWVLSKKMHQINLIYWKCHQLA